MITKEAKTYYIKTGGVRCPYCKSYDIEEHGHFITYPLGCYVTVYCNTCNKRWKDKFTLTNIIEIED